MNKEILISKYLGQIYCWSKGPILTLDNFEDLIYYLYITEHTRECVFFWDLLLFYVNMVVRFQDLYKIRWFVLKLLKHFGQANFTNNFFTRYSSNDLEMTSTLEIFLRYFNFKSVNFLQMFCDMKTQNWFVFIWLVKLADLFSDMSIILSTIKLWWIFLTLIPR